MVKEAALRLICVSLVCCFSCLRIKGQTPTPSPEDHFSGVNARGDQAMGFSHEKTTKKARVQDVS